MIHRFYINDQDITSVYGYYMTNKSLGINSPRTYTVEIPGRNGFLDYTDFYGNVTYSSRDIVIEMKKKKPEDDTLRTSFYSAFNGKRVKVVFDDDINHYYLGRLSVTKDIDDGCVQTLEVTIVANPFKYKVSDDTEVR